MDNLKKLLIGTLLFSLIVAFAIGCVNTESQLNDNHISKLQQVLNEDKRYIVVNTMDMGYVQVESFLNMLPEDEYRLIAATSKFSERINFVIIERIEE